jgi:hypothetical protein
MNIQNITNFINGNKAILMIALVLSSAIAYRYFTAPPPGFCVAQNRFVLSEEFIDRAMESSSSEEKGNALIECCVVGRLEGNFIAKMLRFDVGVQVLLERSPSNKKEALDFGESITSMVILDSCAIGRVPEDDGRSPWSRSDFVVSDGFGVIGGRPLQESKNFVKWPK